MNSLQLLEFMNNISVLHGRWISKYRKIELIIQISNDKLFADISITIIPYQNSIESIESPAYISICTIQILKRSQTPKFLISMTLMGKWSTW